MNNTNKQSDLDKRTPHGIWCEWCGAIYDRCDGGLECANAEHEGGMEETGGHCDVECFAGRRQKNSRPGYKLFT